MYYLVEFTKPGHLKVLIASTDYELTLAEMARIPNKKGRNRAIVSDTPATLDLHIDCRSRTARVM